MDIVTLIAASLFGFLSALAFARYRSDNIMSIEVLAIAILAGPIGGVLGHWIARDLLNMSSLGDGWKHIVPFMYGLAGSLVVYGAVTLLVPNSFLKRGSNKSVPTKLKDAAQLDGWKYDEPKPPEELTVDQAHRQAAMPANADVEAAQQPKKVFISYRRSDSADIAGRIYDRLVQHLEKANVFKDVDSIPFGVDVREYIDEQVKVCDVFIAIIGDQWESVTDENNNPRLADPLDFVRIEIESALKREIPVIPLLVRGATMPSAGELPGVLADLAFRNGIHIRPDPDFHKDMDRLLSGL